MVDCYELTWKG